ncbi:hypothetical protein ACFWNG_08460 [Streptomyces sp. NPDC058391]|uniref:hypothetical protein n=1 Tax=Streptomyces sp. NPDC058391 TaxID=3346476 RepID=UPI003669C1BC
MSIRLKPSTVDGRLQDVFGAPVAQLYERAISADASPAMTRALELRSFLALAEEQVVRVRDRVHDRDVGGDGECPVGGHLRALVPGQGTPQMRREDLDRGGASVAPPPAEVDPDDPGRFPGAVALLQELEVCGPLPDQPSGPRRPVLADLEVWLRSFLGTAFVGGFRRQLVINQSVNVEEK